MTAATDAQVFRVGPFAFRVEGPRPPVDPDLGPAEALPGAPLESVTLRLTREEGPPYVPLPPPFTGARHRFDVMPDPAAPDEAARCESYFVRGRLPFDAPLAEATWRPGPDEQARLVLHNLLRHWAALRMVRHRLLMLHAGGVLVGGRAVLFTGVSGAGKSTATGFAAAKFPALGDDIVALDFRGIAPRVLTLPALNPKRPPTAPPGPHELALLCTLRKANAPALAPIADGATRLSRLISQAPFVNTLPPLAGRALDLLAESVERLPMAELSFRKDDGFLPLLETTALAR